MPEIPIDKIDCNRFNSRQRYPTESIERLASSLSNNGQLVAIRVRRCSHRPERYELVYGHRRYLAAKKLGWSTIKADIVDVNDEQMMRFSLVENLERENLSDFEKAFTLERISKEFNLTYNNIARTLGISKQSVSNYIAMLRLFTNEELAKNPQLLQDLHAITEHHARILSRISDTGTRMDLLHTVVKEGLSVRELSNIVGRLRSWFGNEDRPNTSKSHLGQSASIAGQKHLREVTDVIRRHFELPETGQFKEFADLHLFDDGFSRFSSYAPYDLAEGNTARSRLHDWFCHVRSQERVTIDNLRVKVFDRVAVATLVLKYTRKGNDKQHTRLSRGTIVLACQHDSWKIFHEHYSNLEQIQVSIAPVSK